MRGNWTTEDKMDYITELMLSDYSNYSKLITSHNVSIFRKILVMCFKADRHDFVGRKAIHEEILSLEKMLDENEMVGECNTYELILWMNDEFTQAIDETMACIQILKRRSGHGKRKSKFYSI